MKLLTSFPVRVCGRRPLCQVPSAMACVLLEGTAKRGPLTLNWVLVLAFIPTALAAAPRWLVCSTNTSRAAQLQSTCSEEYTDEHPRATSARTGFRKGLHQIELLCRAEGRQSSINSYCHAAYPRQRASGTCMKQPSRLGIGSCTAESWYVCFPYRHLSWFAVRRSSICLLLCAACAPPCQSALSPWRVCKRFAQARPHSDSRMDFFVTL